MVQRWSTIEIALAGVALLKLVVALYPLRGLFAL
jgi:hypothetical protein